MGGRLSSSLKCRLLFAGQGECLSQPTHGVTMGLSQSPLEVLDGTLTDSRPLSQAGLRQAR
jgi:hypothetical protein